MKRSTATVDCPKTMVGRVIGKNGETIKALQTYSGALIQIDQTCDPTKVTISGTPHSLNLAVSMVSDIVKGTFKGFALLRQLGHPLDPRQPGVPAPRPVYAPGYGLVPPNQLYGADMPGGGDAAEAGEHAGLVQVGWSQAAMPHPMMMAAAQPGPMLMRPGMPGGGMVPLAAGAPGVGQRPEEQGYMNYPAAVPMGGYMYSADQLNRMPGGDVGYSMVPNVAGAVGSTSRMYGAAAAASGVGPRSQLASRGQWAGGSGLGAMEMMGGGRGQLAPTGMGVGPGMGPNSGARLVPVMDASGAMFYMEQPSGMGGGPGGGSM